MKALLAALAGTTALLSACSSPQEQAANEAAAQMNLATPTSTNMAGNPLPALGLTEQQLTEADLVDTKGEDLGDITAVIRGTTGQVEQLRVELEGSAPERFVQIPLDGLSPRQEGDDWTIVTSLTKQQLAALPDAPPFTAQRTDDSQASTLSNTTTFTR